MKKKIVSYQNGNYRVYIDLDNGTKMRYNDLDTFEPEFPESMDIKICNRCNMGCEMCHENSTKDGALGDIMNAKFIDTLHPYTELAIGGGNPLEHPDLEAFLIKCKALNLIPSMTVHQVHFMENIEFLRHLRDEKLIYGLGISVTNPSDEFIEAVREFPNAVIHLIAGYTLKSTFEELAFKNLKILILGYKIFRRGESLYKKDSEVIDYRLQEMYDLLPTMLHDGWFKVISFDNLAIKQLNPKRMMTEEEWDEFYMGDDGDMTMYVDIVAKQFGVSSTATVRHSMLDNIKDMFNIVKGTKNEK